MLIVDEGPMDESFGWIGWNQDSGYLSGIGLGMWMGWGHWDRDNGL